MVYNDIRIHIIGITHAFSNWFLNVFCLRQNELYNYRNKQYNTGAVPCYTIKK